MKEEIDISLLKRFVEAQEQDNYLWFPTENEISHYIQNILRVTHHIVENTLSDGLRDKIEEYIHLMLKESKEKCH